MTRAQFIKLINQYLPDNSNYIVYNVELDPTLMILDFRVKVKFSNDIKVGDYKLVSILDED